MKKQAVILAAGQSTRTFPLTLTRPKPLLSVAGKTLIEHNLDALQKLGIEEVAIVVGYQKEKLISYLQNKNLPFRFHFVEQEKPLGTAHALNQVRPLGLQDFLVLMGDDVYFAEDLEKLAENPQGILGYFVKDASRFGVLEVEGNRLKKILEKPPHIQEGLVNTGAYAFTSAIFDHLDVEASERGELELTDAATALSARSPVVVAEGKKWIPVTYPWSLLDVNRAFLSMLSKYISPEAEVEQGATLKGNIHIEKGTLVKAGAYLEGPIWIGENCTIGPNCYIRPYTTMGNKCKVGNGCELKESIFFNEVKMGHLSYIGDSILGEDVNVGAGTLVANLKHNNTTVESRVGDKIVDTRRRKLGTILGDGVRLGIGTKIYPGRKIWPKKYTMPGEEVKRDKNK